MPESKAEDNKPDVEMQNDEQKTERFKKQ